MKGDSSVGTSAVYEADDQRNVKKSEIPSGEPYGEGKVNSHDIHDSKDQRSIANRMAAEEHKSEPQDDRETAMSKKDSTLPAKMHGNEPSKGAKIDQELQEEEEQILKKKKGTDSLPGKK